uniref:Uncharacterized protein n=1 Tax=Anguilla anguilla TaxID=7936 RepID=A0A0E9U8M1_ANGAN
MCIFGVPQEYESVEVRCIRVSCSGYLENSSNLSKTI